MQEVFAGWTCSAHVLDMAISSVLRSVLSQSEGITKLGVFEDTVVRFLTSAIHTFKLGWVTVCMLCIKRMYAVAIPRASLT